MPPIGPDEATVAEAAVTSRDRGGADAQLRRERSDGGQPLAGPELIAAASLTRAGPSYAALLIAAIAIGIGECFHTTALMPLVADMAPAALRGRYMATMSLSWWIGLALAPTVGTRLLAASPAAALLPAAGLTVTAGVAALALGRHLPAAISRTPDPSAVTAGGEA